MKSSVLALIFSLFFCSSYVKAEAFNKLFGRSDQATNAQNGVCAGPWKNPFQTGNTFSFRNFAVPGMPGQCWGISTLHAALLSPNASFSKASSTSAKSSGSLTQKLDRLIRGEPVTFSEAANIRDLTKKYQSEIKSYVAKLQKKKAFKLSNLFWVTSVNGAKKNQQQMSKLEEIQREGQKINIVVQPVGKLDKQHVLFADHVEKRGNNLVITTADSNQPGRKVTVTCSVDGKCTSNHSGGVTQSVGLQVVDRKDSKRNQGECAPKNRKEPAQTERSTHLASN